MPILQLTSIVIAFVIGLLVVTRNARDRNRWLLFFFNISICIWVLSNVLADKPGDLVVLWNRLVFVAALLTALAAYLLAASMGNRLKGVAALVSLVVLGWIAVIISTPLVVSGVQPRIAQGVTHGFDVIRGPAYPLYVASVLAGSIGIVAFLLYLKRKSRGRFRSQLGIILAGFGTMIFIGFTTGVVLPLVFGTSEPANFTYLGAFAVMAAFMYSILQQRLFDIRLAVARSLGYFLALTLIIIFYTFGIFSLSGVLFKDQADIGLRTYYVIAALFVAITFTPLTRFFSRITNRIFFRDAYDTEEVFRKLTASLVGAVDLELLASVAGKILQNAIKVDSLEIITIKDDAMYGQLFRSLHAGGETVLVTDELAVHHKRIAEKLYEANIALIARLNTRQGVVGYLVCGPKIRGDALTAQDIELLHVAAGELAVAVQNALRFEEISHFNITLKQEVDEATAQLRESNLKLKRLDEAKDEFISMASHQLRTPLTSVKGYISMVMEGDAGKLSAPQQKLLQEAFNSAQRMVYLIGDFLNVSRLQTGRFTLEPRKTDLAQVVSDEVSQLESTAQRREITLVYHHPVQFPIVALDENKIRQVIMNFIDNAIFYSKSGGRVDVALVSTGTEIRFEVHDNGIGVPEAERHKLFTKFFRAKNARRVRPDGTGIGLFMAKKVIAAHGGSLVFDTKENRGSTFGFILPIAALKELSKQLKN